MTMEPQDQARTCRATTPPSSCPRCGNSRLDARHCKLLCLNCGYVESCEDLFEYEAPDGAVDRGIC